MKNLVFYIALGIIFILHAVGLYGILYGDRNHYIQLTWVNLLVTGICFLVYGITERLKDHKNLKRYLLLFAAVSILGFLVEVMGVKTGKIFGIYQYGDRLGWRFQDVPLIIGLNWGMLVFSVAALVNRLKYNTLVKAWAGATLLVILDLLIEPVAMRFFYWTWDIKVIPVQNFIAWWLVSFLLLLFCFRFVKNPHNRLGIYVYFIQVAFFTSLHLLLK
jgi:putative membrane protein